MNLFAYFCSYSGRSSKLPTKACVGWCFCYFESSCVSLSFTSLELCPLCCVTSEFNYKSSFSSFEFSFKSSFFCPLIIYCLSDCWSA